MRLRLALAAALVAGSAQAAAPLADPGQDVGLDRVVVTANRAPARLDSVAASVTIIDQAQIRAAQASAVVDLLAAAPGVTFSRNGTLGKTTSLNIRGAETDQTVVLIDGVKLNDPSATGGGFNAGNLLTGDVSRIEVLRGPQSTLWGGQAIGGVINIITREPAGPFEGDLTGEGGSYHTAYLRAGAGGQGENLSWRLAGGYYTTDGVSAYAPGTEADGYRNIGASGRLRYSFTPDLSLDLRSVYSKGHNEFDLTNADSPQTGDTRELVAYAGLNAAAFDGRLNQRLAYAVTDTRRTNQDPTQRNTTATFDAAGRNRRVEYQGSFTPADGYRLVFGGERETAQFHSASPTALVPSPVPGVGHAAITGLYAQAEGQVAPGLTLTAGLRRDRHDTFGAHLVGQAGAAWSLNAGATVLRAGYAEGFKAPSLFQLYSDFGNLGLNPESARSWEAGVEQRFLDGRLQVQLTGFQRRTRDQIGFVSCSAGDRLCAGRAPGAQGYYSNTARTQAKGVELAATARPLQRLTLSANYTRLAAQDASAGSAVNGRFLPRRPKQTANLSVTYAAPSKLTLTAAARYAGSSFNNAANTQRLKPYTLVDLRAAYPLNPHLEIYARVENLFEQTYQTILNYGTLGQGTYAGLRYTF